MSAMISLKASKSTSTTNSSANITLNNNVSVSPERLSAIATPERLGASVMSPSTSGGLSASSPLSNDVEVKYIPTEDGNPYTNLTLETLSAKVKGLENLCEVQKCVIQMMADNPIRMKDFIVADDVVLMKFIQLLTDAESVELDVEDLGQGCFTTHVYRKVNEIYVTTKDGKVENARYCHADVMKILKDLRISTKFVY